MAPTPDPAAIPCPCCDHAGSVPVLDAGLLPANTTAPAPTRGAALAAARGPLRLSVCPACGFLYNTAYDPALIQLGPDLEETQGFSPTFVRFHEGLAADLARRHDLSGKRVVEIGCGKGEFLAILARVADGTGLGFDPGFVPGRAGAGEERIRVEPRLFGPGDAEAVRGDLFACKMTLEHIQHPPAFLDLFRRASLASGGAPVFFMVPETRVILERMQLWDLYFEHCSNFTPGSLARLFARCGFTLTDLRTVFDGHYLIAEAVPGPPSPRHDLEEAAGETVAIATAFGHAAGERLAGWRARQEGWGRDGRRVVLWGAGSRTTTLINMAGLDERLAGVVDINPHRRGTFVPGTGHAVVGPGDLPDLRPDLVVVMNPVYREEIRGMLAAHGLHPVLKDA